MSEIWNTLIDCETRIIQLLNHNCNEIQDHSMNRFNQPDNGWINRVWKNDSVRRAHVDVVDAREQRGLWMMHVCLFPTIGNDAPIYGFDVIAGKNKITGAFLDFSTTTNHEHQMQKDYQKIVEDFVPEKSRDLPQWARNIFSSHMIAAGNVRDQKEATEIVRLALETMEYYIGNVCKYNGVSDNDISIMAQNYYCENQRKNPHTPRVMKSLGLDESDVDEFCGDVLFPFVPLNESKADVVI